MTKKAICHLLLFFVGLICSCALSSCDQNKKKAEQTVSDFYHSAYARDQKTMLANYPNLENIGYFYPKSDNFEIVKTEKNGENGYLIEIGSTNDVDNMSVSFYLVPKDESSKNEYIITDSEGLFIPEDDELYDFALNTGCLRKHEYSDLANADGIARARALYRFFCIVFEGNMIRDVRIDKWKAYTKNYGVQFQGVAKNDSEYDLYDVKYKIQFVNSNYDVTGTYEGTLIKGRFRSHTSQSFTVDIYSVGERQAIVDLCIDEDFIKEQVKIAHYSGDEYKRFEE